MADIAIRAHDVSKRFVTHTERSTSLKERLIRRKSSSHEFFALRNFSADLDSGSTVGLIGANGAGKSTLLKVLAGILRPTSGLVEVRGRIASLLELGAGFNGELTGRENVYLNASLLGLSRRETDQRFDSILHFSELEEFIDNPVKHYSSGMYVRLGFSVAVHVDPDILLVDEVLAVGDEHFARKCLEKISEFQADGRTILFVSHGLDLVERICTRAIVLNHGQTEFDGDPYFAAEALRKILGTDIPARVPDVTPDEGISFRQVTCSDVAGGHARAEFRGGAPLVIRVEAYVAEQWRKEVDQVQVVVMGVGDLPIWSMTAERGELPSDRAEWTIDFIIERCPLVQGRFVTAVGLVNAAGESIAATRTQTAFGVKSGQAAGLVKADYRVEAAPKGPAG
ncbi:MAG: ABC transporter ATP-binding protein [Actinomycetota bacterium]